MTSYYTSTRTKRRIGTGIRDPRITAGAQVQRTGDQIRHTLTPLSLAFSWVLVFNSNLVASDLSLAERGSFFSSFYF